MFHINLVSSRFFHFCAGHRGSQSYSIFRNVSLSLIKSRGSPALSFQIPHLILIQTFSSESISKAERQQNQQRYHLFFRTSNYLSL